MLKELIDRFQKGHGYKLLHNGAMEKTIISVEKICPVCGYNHVSYIDREEYSSSHRHQYLYRCSSCNSQWRGMKYDKNYKII